MTVAEIQEYIDKQKTRLEKIEVNLSNRDMRTMLSEIKYMLDELDRPLVDIINEMNTELTKIDRAEKQMTNSDFYYTLAYYRDLLDELKENNK